MAPIASGSLFTKVARGFREFIDAGLLERRAARASTAPRRSAARRSRPRSRPGTDVCRPVKPDTIAKSLAIGNPADGPYAVELARDTGGGIDSVTDDEIRAGIRLLAETTGIFTETAGGVTTAVLAKLAERGDIGRDERVVAYITGDGLKTLDSGARHVRGDRDRAVDRRVRRGVRAGRGRGLMAVTVKLPTQLRDAAGGADVDRGRAARRSARRSRRSTPSTASCAGGSPTTTAACGASSTSTSAARTSASSTGSTRRVADGDELTILPAVAGG